MIPSDWFDFIVIGLATYRIAFAISTEEGPFSIFLNLRTALGAYDYAENSEPKTVWGRGISCPLCVGFWVSLLFLGMYACRFMPFNIFLLWMGIAGLQVFFNSLNYRN